MLKKLLSIILILSIIMGTTLDVSAAESNSNTQFKPLSEITTDELTIFALNFARDFELRLHFINTQLLVKFFSFFPKIYFR